MTFLPVAVDHGGQVHPPFPGRDVGDVADHLGARDFTATVPGTKMIGDITYVPTWEGWVYLATVIDCYSKKVIAYAMDDNYKTPLITTAIRRAAHNEHLAPGAIFHTDRGSTPRSATPTGSWKPACRPPSGPSATATTTLSLRPSTACTRPNSCSGRAPGKAPTTSSSRPWAGSTGSTTPACTPPWATGPQPRSNPSTTVRSTPPSDRSWENPPCSEPGATHSTWRPVGRGWWPARRARPPVSSSWRPRSRT